MILLRKDLYTELNFKIKMAESTLQSYVLRTKSIEEKDFQRKVSELGSQLEGIVIVDAEDKYALVRYGGPVEDLYQALGYSNKEVVITLERDYSLPDTKQVVSKKAVE